MDLLPMLPLRLFVPGYRILEIICSLFPVWASVVNVTQGGQQYHPGLSLPNHQSLQSKSEALERLNVQILGPQQLNLNLNSMAGSCWLVLSKSIV